MAMETGTDWEHQEATVHCYLPVCATLSREENEETVIHELVHMLTNPVWKHLGSWPDEVEVLNEFQTTLLTRAIRNVAASSPQKAVHGK